MKQLYEWDEDAVYSDRCPRCEGVLDSSRFDSDNEGDRITETTYLSCVKCGTQYKIVTMYSMISRDVFNDDDEEE